MNRRNFIARSAAAGFAGMLPAYRSTAELASAADIPVTGPAHPELATLDDWVKSFLAENKIPGAALAIAREGKVIHARGFGMADREAGTKVEPDNLFRIASISKPITAVAIMKFVQAGKLKLDDKILDHIPNERHFEEGGKFDERWRQITIEHCLAHIGGWDRDKSYDPMFEPLRMSRSLHVSLPITPAQIIRYQLGQPLDFDPGTRYAYSNFGYSILGRILEKLSSQPYDKHVLDAVFKPLGIDRPRIGGSLESQRVEGEVKYYDANNGREVAVVGPGAGKDKVPIGYGTWCQETLDSHGGWIMSAIDLVKFGAALDYVDGGSKVRSGLVTADSARAMFSPHSTIPGRDGGKSTASYGLGWMLKTENEQMTARHSGALPTTSSVLIHYPDSVNVAIVTNLGRTPDGQFFGRRLEEPLVKLIREVKAWPVAG